MAKPSAHMLGALQDTLNISQLRREFSNEDALGTVIRGHVHIQALLVQLIEQGLKKPQHIDLFRLPFGDLVDLSVAVGSLPKELAYGIKALNAMRNKFAHRFGYSLTTKDIEDFRVALSTEIRQLAESMGWFEGNGEDRLKNYVISLAIDLAGRVDPRKLGRNTTLI